MDSTDLARRTGSDVYNVDAVELIRRSAEELQRAGHPLVAAIVYGEALKQNFDEPRFLIGFSTHLRASTGPFVRKQFIQWAARVCERCLLVEHTGTSADDARKLLADLVTRPEYKKLPPLERTDLDALVDFLDIEPAALMANAVASVPAHDRMGVIMALGELGSPRCASAIATAIRGDWGEGPSSAALKRIRPYAGHRVVRDALVAARAREDAEALFSPDLQAAEAMVRSIPITVEPPVVTRRVHPRDTDDEAIAPLAKKPWWKFWD